MTGIELTFCTPGAAEAIARTRRALPEALVGAGTVLDQATLAAACDAGALFLVSPHTDDELLAAARERQIPFLAGALTPTEVVRAWKAGAAARLYFLESGASQRASQVVYDRRPQLPQEALVQSQSQSQSQSGIRAPGISS